jgi:hypothetical protein
VVAKDDSSTITIHFPEPTPLPLLDERRLQRNTGILDGMFSTHQTHHEVDVCIRDQWPDTPTCNAWARDLLRMEQRFYTPVAQEAKVETKSTTPPSTQK